MTTSSDTPGTEAGPGSLSLEALNGADEAYAASVLRPCLDVDRWVSSIVAGRPYADREALLVRARGAADSLTTDEIEAALAHHPRIGEQPRTASAEAEHSRAEQSGLDLGGDVEARLEAGNRAYEERFGRVFLIRAAGRTSAEILAALHTRLGNDPDVELTVVGQQLGQIALLRLEGRVS